MAKKKISNPGPPSWYSNAHEFVTAASKLDLIQADRKLTEVAELHGLTTRLLKRYVKIHQFLNKHFSEELKYLTDQTAYSTFEELMRLHQVDKDSAQAVVQGCLDGSVKYHDLKRIGGQGKPKPGGIDESLIGNSRRASRIAGMAFEKLVFETLGNCPELFGIKEGFELVKHPDLPIGTDIVLKTESGKLIAIEIKYVAHTTTPSVLNDSLLKIAWLNHQFDEVILCVNQIPQTEQDRLTKLFKSWTSKNLKLVVMAD